MSTRILTGALVAGYVLAGAAAANAAPIDHLIVTDPGLITGTGEAFNEPGGLGFDLFGAGTSTIPGAPGSLEVLVPLADVSFGGGAFTGSGVLDVYDGLPFDPFLGGASLVNAGFALNVSGTDDRIDLLFDGLSGAGAAAFDRFALVSLFGEFGDDPFGTGFGDFSNPSIGIPVDVTFSISAAEVPAPAGLAVMVTGLVGLGALGHRRRSAA